MPRLSKIGAAALAAFGWTGLQSVTVNYLVVAGGGGGGFDRAGGGGGGGYRTSAGTSGGGGSAEGKISLNPTLSYAVTVGAGGAGSSNSNNTGVNGSDSVFSTVTSTGGGGGGSVSSGNGVAGGSGGGARNNSSATGGAGTANQGYAGGNNTTNDGGIAAGGGGAGSVGKNGNPETVNRGYGGSGVASSITGTSVTRGGGGGAGGASSGFGSGQDGGGNGADASNNSTAGTANSGGGGGGGNAAQTFPGASGGSGVVIISYTSATQLFGGGTVTKSGGNFIHTFNTSNTLSPLSSVTASYLVVAGGGGGGYDIGAGAGAGGLLSGTGLALDTNSIYTVTVGGGGTRATSATTGGNGTNSSFSVVTTSAVGGGGGASNGGTYNGASGGSGGGGAITGSGGAGTSGQGNSGGNSNGNLSGGGGGGAGAAGAAGVTSQAGAGGVGLANPITGSTAGQNVSGTYYLAGGGGAGGYAAVSLVSGAGGNGGGGAGGGTGAAGTAGTPNTGGGGGSGGQGVGGGGIGGSGVVIISYAGSTQQMAGGTVTISGGNVIHTFTSSGYLTPIKYVNNSLRFRSSGYLNRTLTTPTNNKIFTWSSWVKRGKLGTAQTIIGGASAGTGQFPIYFTANDQLAFYDSDGVSTYYQIGTTAVFRDPAAWYHVVMVFDSANATQANRLILYVNGVQQTLSSIGGSPGGLLPLNRPSYWNASGAANNIGCYYLSSTAYNLLDGYLTEINFIDGQALTPNSFGTFNSYGVWQPITYGGSYGTNGFYLPFTNKTSTTTLGYDFSPNGNNWTPNNISVTAGATYDSMTDVPTLTSATAANYAVLNPVNLGDNNTLSNANLTGTIATTSGRPIYGSIAVTSGKWYWETLYTASTSDALYIGVNGASLGQNINAYSTSPNIIYGQGIVSRNNSTIVSSLATITVNDIVGVALDVDSGTIAFYKNNTLLTTQNLPTGDGFGWRPLWLNGTSGGNQTYAVTFGQRPFSYTPPTGFVALNTYNLPAGTITTSGSFTGNVSTDGPFVYLNGVPTAMTINGNAVTFGTNADKLANGFKVRSSSSSYNASGSNTYSITTTDAKFKNANAQTNP